MLAGWLINNDTDIQVCRLSSSHKHVGKEEGQAKCLNPSATQPLNFEQFPQNHQHKIKNYDIKIN